MENNREQLPVKVVDRLLGGDCKVRVALAVHPTTGEVAPCVPVMDYAEVFSYDREALRKMLDRTDWLKKHTLSVIMTDSQGQYRPHQAMFEEAMLGVFMKLQPQRCKDPEVARRVNERQEEMVLILKDVLKGYRPKGFCEEDSSLARRSTISASAIPALCRQANRGCRFSARALNHFYGMPVEDLQDDTFAADPDTSETAALIARFLRVLLEDGAVPELVKDGEDAITGTTRAFLSAFEEISRRRDLPKFFTNVHSLGKTLAFERDALEAIGWRREFAGKKHGELHYRFIRITH